MSSNRYINFFNEVEKLVNSRNQVSAKLAEDSAEYPDLSVRFLNCESALDYILSYGALLMKIKSTNYVVAYNYLEKMNKKGYHYKYEGKWTMVKSLVSLPRIYYLQTYIDFLFDNFSEDDIYGNLIRRIVYYMGHCRVRKMSNVRTKVRYPERKRGYTDKGSRRPSEKWLPKIYQELYSFEKEKNEIELVEVTPPHHKTEWVSKK